MNWIIVYFWCNSLIVAFYIGDNLPHARRDFALLYLLIGVPAWVYVLLDSLFGKVMVSLELKTWYQLYFTDTFNNLTSKQLDRLNKAALLEKGSIRSWMLNKIIPIINKRNNYDKTRIL